MSYTNSKKAVLATYEILKKYSTEEHPLSNLKIQEHLKSDYELKKKVPDTINWSLWCQVPFFTFLLWTTVY
ncbi:hypothetical protein SAMN05421730_10141 [Anaerobium acetethylicum]|uniref:Uncharacterized protein n=1 Tax=Anaerobium acetethylicum TaxID=1619234 RepID=A0A1D3TUN4_9FIRM|nr:hypothetical protein SAMN05421730_10141 [Anaerobium acetethylicum]